MSIRLERTPEIASRIGVLLGLFALIERFAFVRVCEIAHLDLRIAQIVIGQQGFGRRIYLLNEAIEITRPDAMVANAPEKTLVRALRLANAIRNKYAHATYAAGGEEGTLTIFLNYYHHERATRTERINVAILDAQIVFFKRVMLALEDDVVGEGNLSTLDEAIRELESISDPE